MLITTITTFFIAKFLNITMQKSVKFEFPSKKRNRECLVEAESNAENIISFMQNFKPLNLVSNALNASKSGNKKRKTNLSKRIIDNMKQKFDSLPPGYYKKRRMSKLNIQGNEQRNIYNNLLEIFREDTENTTPFKPQSYTQVKMNNPATPMENSSTIPFLPPTQKQTAKVAEEEIDSLLQEELYFQRDYIHCTMEELYDIAKIPKHSAEYMGTYQQAYEYTPFFISDAYNTTSYFTNDNGFTYYTYLPPSHQGVLYITD